MFKQKVKKFNSKHYKSFRRILTHKIKAAEFSYLQLWAIMKKGTLWLKEKRESV